MSDSQVDVKWIKTNKLSQASRRLLPNNHSITICINGSHLPIEGWWYIDGQDLIAPLPSCMLLRVWLNRRVAYGCVLTKQTSRQMVHDPYLHACVPIKNSRSVGSNIAAQLTRCSSSQRLSHNRTCFYHIGFNESGVLIRQQGTWARCTSTSYRPNT